MIKQGTLYYSVSTYTITFFLRMAISFILVCISFGGLGVAVNSKLDFRKFQISFFTIVAAFEIASILLTFWLYRKQRPLHDLSEVVQRDCQYTCLSLFLRVVWHVAMSLFIIVRIYQMEEEGPDVMGVRAITFIIMTFSVLYLIGFLIGVVYQPEEWIRE